MKKKVYGVGLKKDEHYASRPNGFRYRQFGLLDQRFDWL